MKNYIVVFITVSSKKESKKITEYLIKNKLAACVNEIPNISSTYWWKEKIEKSKELLLVIKTKKSVLNKLIKEVKKIHSYSVPEVIALPIIDGNKDYLDWINSSI
ncbi:MAG: divalent-cation tolerance protein CutA [Candidatus Firestonebacteria bacterium]